MGRVFAATHLQLQERVAIKVLHAEMTTRQDVVDRFLREARAAVRLKSEHVARILDVGVTPHGVPYIVMEYLEGADLNARSARRIPPSIAVDYVLQACEAMAEAHAQSIVHRDIKPANLFVAHRPDGSPLVKVLDFGISKALDRDLNLTGSQATLGTPAYMSPEQLRASRDVDTRTDIWSLGVVLFELVSGFHPYDAQTFGELVIQVVTQLPRTLPRDVDRGLAAVILHCLERDPALRFQTVGELARALVPFTSNRVAAQLAAERTANILRRSSPSIARPDPAATAPGVLGPGAAPTTLGTSAGSMHVTNRRSRLGWTLGGLGALTVVVVAVALLATSDHRESATPAGAASRADASSRSSTTLDAPPAPTPIDAAPAVTLTAVPPADATVVPIDAGAPDAKPATKPRPPPPPRPRPAPPPAPVDPLGTRT